jgi:uncharacterized protein (TIGR01777 family)
MTGLLWTLVALQIAMGAFDTLFHHEGTERLAWRPSQRLELKLHGVRNLLYALMFAALGWSEPRGALAWALGALLAVELFITLWDFVEEDRTRHLPASERVTHTLLSLNYGAILALLTPVLLGWAALPTALAPACHGLWSWLCAAAALATAICGVRDLFAASRAGRLVESDAAWLADGLKPNSSVLVTGGTGFVGSRLVAALAASGHDVTVLTRRRDAAAGLPAPLRIVTDLKQIPSGARIDAIVNLAGEPIASGRWTRAKRRRIVESRLGVTWAVGQLIERLERKPQTLVSGSAIGWYGLRGDEPLGEDAQWTDCFSHSLCSAWEYAAQLAAGRGVRLVLLRTGLVLGREGGMLGRMLAPFEFGLGGRFGSGRQWMSWIHRDDLVRLIVRAIADPALRGPLNGTAPNPVDNAGFARALGRALGRPAVLPVPAKPLRLALGALADELLLGGQRVMPAKAQAAGFRFAFPTLDEALAGIVGRQPPARPSSSSKASFKELPA